LLGQDLQVLADQRQPRIGPEKSHRGAPSCHVGKREIKPGRVFCTGSRAEMPISQSNTGENSPVIAGHQIVGKYVAVLTVFELPRLNGFSNNPLHSRPK
jgi:hypothetical protein